MKFTGLVLATSMLMMLLAGCSSTSYQGGTDSRYHVTTNSAETYPEPAGSPTLRPGLNPQDPRDAQFETRPRPAEPPQP